MQSNGLERPKVIEVKPVGTGPDPALELPALEQGDSCRFHTMIKPSGAQCNLDCHYCYYLHKEDLLGRPKKPRMSESLLEAHVRQYIASQTADEVVFSWLYI